MLIHKGIQEVQIGTKETTRRRSLFCTHCNMTGHTVDKCYKLHGYPLGYKPKGKPNANANQVSSKLVANAENLPVIVN